MKRNIYIIAVSMLSSFCFLTGCSNTDEQETMSTTGDYSGKPIPVIVKSIGVETPTVTRSTATKSFYVQPLNEYRDTGLDFEITVEEIQPVSTRANVNLADTQYRLLAYKGNVVAVNNYVGQCDYVTDANGVPTAVDGNELLLPGGIYTFVAYCYGKNEVILPFDGSLLTIAVKQGDDFMTYLKTVEVKADENGLFNLGAVLFSRHCSSIKMIVKATGFPESSIKACAATIGQLNDNELMWAVGTNGLPLTGTKGSVNAVWNTLNSESVISDSTLVFAIDQRNLEVTFTSLTIGEENLANSVVKVPQKLDPSRYYSITINIARNYIPVGGEKWAKGNVYKSGNDFFIEATQEGYHEGELGGSYFGWNTLEITDGAKNSGNYDYNSDPCSMIAPKGNWKIPTRAQTEKLKKDGYRRTTVAPIGYWFGKAPNELFLPSAGFRVNGNGNPEGVVGIGEFGGYSLYDNTPGYSQCFFMDNESAEYFSELERTYGLLIRCVK